MKDISIEGRCPKCGDTEHLVLRMFDDEEDEEDELVVLQNLPVPI